MTRFRTDVEGLRAVAISIVVLAHADLGFAAGGYVGVDVFFVISGFLITHALVGELERTGRVCVARFYARRVKRLMPQVLAVIAAVVVGSSLLLSPVRAEAVAADVVAAGAYAMNWHLSAEAADYFASGAQDRPLDHFWSLAVEEQFYLVWPWLLLAVAWVRRSRRVLLLALGAVAAASFAYAVARVRVAPEAVYYSAFARAWELALGALLAVVLVDRRTGPRAAAVYGWAGLAAVAAATVAFGEATPFPGPAALLPTCGAVALIAAGTCPRPAQPTRWLMLRPVCWIGRVSYAWYVWHWPVLVFAGDALGPLRPWERGAVALASLAPAWATFRWIEEPVRRSTLHLRRPRVTLAAGLAGPALAIGVGLALSASISSPPALAAAEAVGAPQLRTGTVQRSATALRPHPRDAGADRGKAFYDGCLVDKPVTSSPPCVYGDRGSDTTVVIFGDSHAMQYFPALERIAIKRQWRLVELTKGGCPPARVPVLYPLTPRMNPACDAWREAALRRIERVERPALVVVGSSVRYTVVERGRRLGRDASTRALAAGYVPTLERLRAAARRVTVLVDPPRPPQNIPECVSGSMRRLRRCAFARGPAVERAFAVRDAVRRIAGIGELDTTSQFCLPRMCPAVVGDVLVYRNSGHITASYMATMTPWLERLLGGAVDARAAVDAAPSNPPRPRGRCRPNRPSAKCAQ